MADLFKKRLGDLLIDYGKITKEQLDSVLVKQKLSGKRLGEILIEDSLVTEEDILDVLEVQLGIERVYLEATSIDKQAVFAIPESLAIKYTLLPIWLNNDKIKVVMSDPLNIFAVDDVKIASGYDVEPAIATKREILEYIGKYYTNQSALRAADELSLGVKRDKATKNADADSDEDDLDDVKNAPAVRLVDSIIKAAVKARASDIHIEPFERYVKVRIRVDGELLETMRPNRDVHGAVVTRIKILGNMNIAEKRIPQDGRILTKVDEVEVDLRVSVIPTIHGEKVVIRLLRRDSFMIGKKEMGMLQDDLEKLDRIGQNSYGIILVTGPTGSGKSTTLYSMLKDLNTPNKNIVTVEDPVEYMMEGINQVNVNAKAGMTFAAGLRSILRQDPDIIMLGEIRDGETAEIAIRAAITGHVVLSTLHTNDAPSTILRLVDMGIEPYLVATSVVGVVSQRLVRRICNYCKEEYTATPEEMRLLGKTGLEQVTLYRGKGCPICSGTGYSGRVGIYEIMEITRDHRHAIMTSKSSDELRDLSIEKGMKTLRDACTESVLNGATTLDELVRIAYLKE
jgi:type IV pilus assembly protein PilB